MVDVKKMDPCPHRMSIGRLAVYVRDSCPHKKLIKGVYVVSGRMCKGCEAERKQKGEAKS